MAEVRLQTIRTSLRHPGEAAEALVGQIEGSEPQLVTLFASRDRDQRALNEEIRKRLPSSTRLVGATTAGEIDNDGFYEGQVVMGVLTGDFEVGLGLGKDLSRDAVRAGSNAVKQACEQLGTKPQDLDVSKHVGLVIDDPFKYKKEEFLLGMLEKNQGLVLVGGGAGDSEKDPAKQSCELHVDGEVATDGVLVALFKTDAPWGALRAHPYTPMGETVTITKVDEDMPGRVIEIDGKPAALRYSELTGTPPAELEFGNPKGFSQTSLGLKVGREYFMRTPWKPILEDNSILFANMMEEDTTLELMKLGDMPAMTKTFFEEEMPRRVRNPNATLLFHCSGRHWVAESLGQVEALGKTFAKAPTAAGMNVYFEIYCGFHINTTLTSLTFGKD